MKQIDTIQYDYTAMTITVNWQDGTSTTYSQVDAAQYLADTGRASDSLAVGWA